MKREIDLDLFDIIEYLDDRGQYYVHAGSKNVSAGWIGLSCPFCGDRSTHLGVNLQSKLYSCFRCGAKGGASKLVMALDNCSFSRAVNTIESFVLRDFSSIKRKERIHANETMLPSGIINDALPIHSKFLLHRRYDADFCVRKYDIMFVGPTLDDWKFRIVIPVYQDHELVTYVARDTSGKLEIPYKNAPIEKSKIQAKHTLYGLDDVKDTAIIVEGIFDAWRIGTGAVATFGTQYTTEQIALLAKKRLGKVFVMFDADATDKAYNLAHDLSSVVPKVEVIELAEGDPDNLTEDEVWELRREVF